MQDCLNEFDKNYTTILGKEESSRFIRNINILNDKL